MENQQAKNNEKNNQISNNNNNTQSNINNTLPQNPQKQQNQNQNQNQKPQERVFVHSRRKVVTPPPVESEEDKNAFVPKHIQKQRQK